MNLTNIQIIWVFSMASLAQESLAFEQVRKDPIFQVNQEIVLKYQHQGVDYSRPEQLVKF